MNCQRQDTFQKLKAIIERESRPPEENDDALLAELRQCQHLPPAMMLHIVASAMQVYDGAIQRNINAMVAERRRLEMQIARLYQELNDNQHRIAIYQRSSWNARRNALTQVVLQRARLDEDSAEMERKSR